MKNGKLYLVSQHPGHNALYFLAAIIVLVALSSRADTIVWTNTAGGNWSAAANWSPNQVPGATDTVQINSAVGNYTVIVDDDATAASLTVGGAASGIQSLDVANGASLTLGTVNSTVNKNGTLTVKAGGTLDVGYYLYLYSPLTNYGTINVTNYSIAIANNGTSYLGSLLNLGRINLLDHNGVGIARNSYNDDYFINEGTVVSAVAATISVSDFDNVDGTVSNLSSGTLTVEYFTNTLAGTYYATNGSTIAFSGGASTNYLTPGTPLVLGGSGNYQFNSGYLALTNDIIANLQLTGGALELGPEFQGGAITNLTLAGITLSNTLPVTGTFNVSGNSPVYGDFAIENGGVLNANGATFHGALTVGDGGVFNDNGSAYLDGSMTVDNGGTLDVGYYLYLYSPLTNYGTINVTNYSIAIANNGTSYLGSLLNLGRINLLDHNGVGIIRNSYNDDYFINEGTVVSAVAATISMSAFTNSGAITAETGTLQLNSVTLQPSGSLNAGLNSASDYGKLSISGNAALAGAFGVQLNNGFVPAPNTPFAVLSYDSFSGNFDSFNLPASLTWQRIYGTNALTLVPRLPFVSKLSGTNLVLNVTRDPGTQFVLLTSTNVTQPLLQWTPLLTNTLDISGYFSVTNLVKPDKPQQFFILKFP
jgi:hypothetical protein